MTHGDADNRLLRFLSMRRELALQDRCYDYAGSVVDAPIFVLMLDVIEAAERRRQGFRIRYAHRHDIDEPGFQVWDLATGDWNQATEDEDAALTALAAHLLDDGA